MKRMLMLACLLSLTAAPALAQPAVEIVPMIGAYVPLGTLVTIEEIDEELGAITTELEHKPALLLGARVDFWTMGNMGLEASLAYAMSDVEATVTTDLGEGSDDMSANTFLAAAKVLYRLGVPGGPARFHLGGGLAMIKHGGDAFEDVDGTTDIGGVVGLGASISLPGTLGIRIDLEDYIYSAKFGEGDNESDSELQNDVVLTAGVAFKLGM